MATKPEWLASASFLLLSQFTPAIGQEYWHCDMKRGFYRVRKKEPAVAAILSQDTAVQRIGLLAQRGVYEFHENSHLLEQTDGVTEVAALLRLQQEVLTVQERVLQILSRYYDNPVLREKNILKLNRGDEGIPKPIELCENSKRFHLYAAIDCTFVEPDGTLHILDLKTGKSDFDLRQGYVYLLAAQYLYPEREVVASFYNLESGQWSEMIRATELQLKAVMANLVRIAQAHDIEKQKYWKNPTDFAKIFSPNPDERRCQHCQFHSVCTFSAWRISA